ncbi:F-box protein SKIP23-like [Rutidosis leptorrhynchoides]|uniref:F-box protein SKIP23-like n=1 Tax=Rutidosis leptorrhynchoides TaxID=125765 RepID=UPI003A9A09D5
MSNLPNDLLVSVAERLSDMDAKRLRAVCSSWRYSVSSRTILYRLQPIQNSSTLLHFPAASNSNSDNDSNTELCDSFKLSRTILYRLQPIQEDTDDRGNYVRLVRVKEITGTGKVQFLDPFGSSQVHTPSSKVLDLLNIRISESTKFYRVEYINTNDSNVYTSPNYVKSWNIKFLKVVLSSRPVSDCHDYAILAIKYIENLCYTKLGDNKWTTLSNDDGIIPLNFRACDVADHKGKFYAVDRKGFVVVLNYSFEVVAVMSSITLEESSHVLVASGEKLYVVQKKENELGNHYVGMKEIFDTSPFHIKVYELNEQQLKWVEVRSLGEKGLFSCATMATFRSHYQN